MENGGTGQCKVQIQEGWPLNIVNLSELTAILQICSTVPQLLVLSELALRLFLHPSGSHILLEEQGAISPRITRCCPASWGSSMTDRLHPPGSQVR